MTEEAEREAREKAMAPDKEKLKEWGKGIAALVDSMPPLSSEEMQTLSGKILRTLAGISVEIKAL